MWPTDCTAGSSSTVEVLELAVVIMGPFMGLGPGVRRW
jgi:hypothetical protein